MTVCSGCRELRRKPNPAESNGCWGNRNFVDLRASTARNWQSKADQNQ